MEHHRRDAMVSAAAGRRETRRAEYYAGYAIWGLGLVVGALTLVVDDLAVPAWTWAGLLAVWFAATTASSSERLRRGMELLSYACAVLSSWALLVTVTSSGSIVVILLIVVAAVGSHLIPMPWVLGIVLLNCLVSFGHMWVSGAGVIESAGFVVFYLFIHMAVVFTAYAAQRESQLRVELEQKNLELEAAGILLEDSVASSERLRISRELHDLIGHQLTVLNLELEAAKHREDATEGGHVERAGVVAKDLLADVRSTVGELREAGPGDLEENLHRLARAVPSLEIHAEVDAGVEVDEEVSATLIRAAQEIITNTIKHADATELVFAVTRDGDVLTLSGANDGLTPRGITPGHGLTGLEERLKLLGGRLSIRTSPHFTVEAQLPMTRDRRARE